MIGWLRRRLEKRKVEKLVLGRSVREMTEKLDRRVEILVERAEAKGVSVGGDGVSS